MREALGMNSETPTKEAIKKTLFLGFSDNLFAKTQPADPAPITM